jgi:hypothetical protein
MKKISQNIAISCVLVDAFANRVILGAPTSKYVELRNPSFIQVTYQRMILGMRGSSFF